MFTDSLSSVPAENFFIYQRAPRSIVCHGKIASKTTKKSPAKKRMFPSLELIVSPGFVIWSLSQSDEAIKFCWRLQKKLSAILQPFVHLIEFPSVDSNSFGRFLALGKVLPFFQKGTAAERCLDIATLSSLGPYQKSCIIWFDFAYRVTVRLFPLFFLNDDDDFGDYCLTECIFIDCELAKFYDSWQKGPFSKKE